MDLRQFRQFVAVAEEMSFRRAAERLHMAQPPLTAAVKRMEAELGVTLLERTSRIVRLTEPGRSFLEEARRTLAQADRAVTAARRAAHGLEGSLRENFLPILAHDLLPRILKTFRLHHPNIELELSEAPTGAQVAALINDHADLGFLVPPVPERAAVAMSIVLHDRLIAALPDGHALARQGHIPLAALESEPWILCPLHQAPGFCGRIIKACAKAGFAPNIAQRAVQMDTILGLIAGNLGVGLVPSMAAKPRKGVIFREVTGAGTPIVYEIAAAWRRGESKPALRAFFQIARAIMRDGAEPAPTETC